MAATRAAPNSKSPASRRRQLVPKTFLGLPQCDCLAGRITQWYQRLPCERSKRLIWLVIGYRAVPPVGCASLIAAVGLFDPAANSVACPPREVMAQGHRVIEGGGIQPGLAGAPCC